MLKQRLITALLLIPFVIWAILGLPTVYLGAMLGVLVLLGAWEWARLIPLRSAAVRAVYVVLMAAAVAITGLYLYRTGTVIWVLAAALVWWLIAVVWVVRYRPCADNTNRACGYAKYAAGFLTLVPAWGALVAIHSAPGNGAWMLLFVMVLMWVADSGAYFAGRAWGRRKLAPRVSPGKTWEGVAGALAAATVYGLVGGWQFGFQAQRLGLFVMLCLVTVGFSIVGDLWESLLKRDQGVKDSGVLLPGHGGVLDRVDSLTAGAPIYLSGLLMLEHWG